MTESESARISSNFSTNRDLRPAQKDTVTISEEKYSSSQSFVIETYHLRNMQKEYNFDPILIKNLSLDDMAGVTKTEVEKENFETSSHYSAKTPGQYYVSILGQEFVQEIPFFTTTTPIMTTVDDFPSLEKLSIQVQN